MSKIRDCINSVPFWQLSALITLSYGLYLGMSLTALIWMAVDAGRHVHAAQYAQNIIFLVNGLHFSFIGIGFGLVDGYEYAPVAPMWAYLFGDFLQAGAFGAFMTALVYDMHGIAVPIVACSVNVAVQFLCFYKYYVLSGDVRAGRRDPHTGQKYT